MSVDPLGGLGAELAANLGFDDVAGVLPQAVDVALKRPVGIVRLKPSIDLLVGQLLQLPSVATHPIVSIARARALRGASQILLTDNG